MAVGSEIRYRIAALLEAYWAEFVRSAKQFVRPVVFETVRKLIACRTPALGCQAPARGSSSRRGLLRL